MMTSNPAIPLTLGVEEEFQLLCPHTLALVPAWMWLSTRVGKHRALLAAHFDEDLVHVHVDDRTADQSAGDRRHLIERLSRCSRGDRQARTSSGEQSVSIHEFLASCAARCPRQD